MKRLLVVNRRLKSNSSTNCANYETASDVRFRFKPEPINNFVRIRKRKKERKKKMERTTMSKLCWEGEIFVVEASGSKKRRDERKTTQKFHLSSDVSGTRPYKTFHFYISSEFPLMSRSPRPNRCIQAAS